MLRPLWFRFAANNTRLDLYPTEVVVEQEVGKIDLYEIKTGSLAPGSPALPQSTPVSFEYGERNSPATATGYVTGSNDAVANSGTSLKGQLVLQCLSPSSVMRNKRRRAWSNISSTEIVRSIASDYRLSVVADPDPLRWTSLAQNGESDWAFICSLAKRLGYWAYVAGTTLYFLNPDLLAGRQDPLSIDPMTDRFGQRTQDQPFVGSAQLAWRRGRFTDVATGRTHFFQPATPRVPVAGRTPDPHSVEDVAIEAPNYAEAKAIYDGIERQSAWYMERRLALPGNVALRPLRTVLLKNPTVRSARVQPTDPGWAAYDGLWVVKAVQHRMIFGRSPSFTTEATLVRDGRGMPNARQRLASPLSFNQQPPSRLMNGTWVAAHGMAVA